MHGILDPLDEVLPSYVLPQMVQAVLLPFKGKIIYDGLLSGYNVHFGGGIRSNLNRIYTIAKQRERIITSLEPDLETESSLKPKKDLAPQLREVSAALAKVKEASPLQRSALTLARLSIQLSLAETEGALSRLELAKRARKISRASQRLLDVMDILEEE